MDHRAPLNCHSVLDFEGMPCHIEEIVGQGSNAIVYKGWYPDHLTPEHRHHVLIKELFPFHPQKKIWRDEKGEVTIAPEAEEFWETHRQSFLSGNDIHLRLLADHPDFLGANLNSFSRNGTLYSVLGYSGGRSLQTGFSDPDIDLRRITCRMVGLLDALEAFHKSGFLHLDISPDNVMLTGQGERERIFLIDYNSARPVGAEESGYLSCKAGYSAPEVETGDTGAIGFPSDLYSVAAVFYRCLMGRTLSLEEMLRPVAPDAAESPWLQDMPQTVVYMVGRILKKGLNALPRKRYQSIGQMRQAFQELQDRINCVGVTHWALWESGKRSVEKLIRDNPSLGYLKDRHGLYPIRLMGKETISLSRYLEELLSARGQSGLILARGGMGKTTMLLHTAMLQGKRYSAGAPAVFYISLNGWNGNETHYIRGQILMSLRFKREMNSYDSAMHALQELLQQPLKTRSGDAPGVLLLLDGLNEVRGDLAPLIQEINALKDLAGVRILAASRSEIPALKLETMRLAPLETEDMEDALALRGLMLPRNDRVRELLRTPLILSVYIQTGETGQQPDVSSEEELMKAYLDSLHQKALRELPEDAPERWQLEAALQYVLPSVAAEESRTGTALTQKRMLRVVERCWKLLRSRSMGRIFPQWIGHSRDILGEAKTAEEWYGIIVHRLLWQRLGLLMHQQPSGYRIFHQNVRDYLVGVNRQTKHRIKKHRVVGISLGAAAAVTVLLLLLQSNPLLGDFLMVAKQKAGASGNVIEMMFDELRDEVHDYWMDNLEVSDQIYGTMLWTMEYVDAYANDTTWENLLKAKTACIAAMETLNSLEAPENPITMWDHLMLTLLRIDTVWLEYGDAEGNLESSRITLNRFFANLEGDVYMKGTVETFPETTRISIDLLKDNLAYQAVTTNYLLAQLDRPEEWKDIKETFPTIGAFCGEWQGDTEQLQDDCDRILDAMEQHAAEDTAFYAASEEMLSILEEAVSTGDLSVLKEEVCAPWGFEQYYVDPGFGFPDYQLYRFEDPQTEELYAIKPGERISQIPDICYMVYSRIPWEQVKDYLQRMDDWGYHTEWYGDNGDEEQIAFISWDKENTEGAMFIEWTESETILYLVEPVSCMIPEVYLVALLAE